MKIINILFCLIFGFVSQAQNTTSYFNNGNTTTQKKYVGASWLPGIIVMEDGRELKGDVRGYSYTGNDIKSFKYRTKKGEKAQKFKAEDCKLIIYDDLIVLSLPKNIKKKSGKRKFYVTIYYGEHLSVFQNPKANVATRTPGAMMFNENQMLSFLVLKDGEIDKLTKLRFRKPMSKICKDNEKFIARSKDKKWFKYDNIYKIAHFYNQTKTN
jgi:hypothetical protein|tara:strand:- start:24 stop:659 length:636 start_codon:yes stop_codon:yes gene_type:complete